MRVVEVLHMNGGIGDTSYANNSLLQQKVILMTKPVTDEAIAGVYADLSPNTISIADLGCSSGPNTFLAVSELMRAVDGARKKLRRHHSPEFHIYLNDLPGNDFNAIFRSLPQYVEGFKEEMGEGFGACFFNGVPGSFYGRLFPTNALHFVHSSYSLMWLSQVPKGAEENKGNIYLAAASPPCVIKAYYEQFQNDFLTFLKCRSKELVIGGRMVLTILGRQSEDPCSNEGGQIWELLAMALNELVDEGFIEEEKLNTFNIPQYTPSPAEVKLLVEKEGSFSVNFLEATNIHWTASEFVDEIRRDQDGYNVTKCMRAVAEPLLVSHFGEGIIEKVFPKYQKKIVDSMSKENTQFFNVIVSLTKIL
ncbi:PREDICTED: salicylate carboxymethyltransferase-like [Ipomoea nil]|uniref:salicylate carboxymethyltransferase-like n=1 Tax=Ipomoea nil TaxID=35883 RepID=UPI0009010A3D|nr:PREDICTED: salicylate carboxymethyltransferase-like [Ipomoea nil]